MPKIFNSASGGCGGVGTISAPTATVGNETTEITLFSYAVAGCTIKANGLLRFCFTLKSRDNIGFAQTPSIKIKFGGTTIIDFGVSHFGFGASHRTTLAGEIQNLNATNAQDAFTDFLDIAGSLANYDAGSTAGGQPVHQQARLATTIDTLGDQTLALTFKWPFGPGQDPSAQCIAEYVEVLD